MVCQEHGPEVKTYDESLHYCIYKVILKTVKDAINNHHFNFTTFVDGKKKT